MAATVVGACLLAVPAAAHTESDVVAVPAGEAATVKLKPTHGCDGSPTVTVTIQAPVEGATAVDVEGWTATATPDGDDTTVLEWTGGSLPADQTGEFPVEFPVEFTAPDTPGMVLTFPSIQTCDNGEELFWISGDPADEFPAPRVLILSAGSAPAATIDDVPADAPGRNQLVEIVDVDNPDATEETPTPEAASPETTTAESPDTTTAGDDQVAAPLPSSGGEEPADESDDGGTSSAFWIAIFVAVFVGGGVAAYAYYAGEKKSEAGPGFENGTGNDPEAT